jgi:choice-of-anchor C domain-containing protein
MRFPVFALVIGQFLMPGLELFARNLLRNGGFERPDGASPIYDELSPGSRDISGWTVGEEGGIDGIRFYWPASAGRDSVDLCHGVLGPGSIFQDVRLIRGRRYRLSFDMAYNPDLTLPVAVQVSIGGATNIFTRDEISRSPFWQRQSFTFVAKKTGAVRLTFAEKRTSETGRNETALDNVTLEKLPRPRVKFFDGPDQYVFPVAVSAKGGVTVGTFDRAKNYGQEPFRFLRGVGIRRIAAPLAAYNAATGVSSNGTVIVGTLNDEGPYDRGFRWTKRTGTVEFYTNLNLSLSPNGVSGDGRVIFGLGWAVTNQSLYLAFRWTSEAGLQLLNTLGGAIGAVSDATHNGEMLVGVAQNFSGRYRACRWMGADVNPEPLASEMANSAAEAITPDGRLMVGSSWETVDAKRMCRWTGTNGSQEILDTNSNYSSTYATDVSAKGDRIVGIGTQGLSVFFALLWTQDDGLKSLDECFSEVLPEGWSFTHAQAISSDGRWIVGQAFKAGWGQVGFVLDTGLVRRRE